MSHDLVWCQQQHVNAPEHYEAGHARSLTPLECAGDAIHLCLAGFVAAIRVSCLLGMGMLRSTFVTSVARFTLLHAPGQMQAKHAKAFRALLVAADENGNHLHVS